MKKEYIIVVVVVLVLWCGFMGHRYHKRKGDTEVYRTKANARITEMAKKSPRAGLTKIGRALKSYYQENRSYPSALMDLYPKYLNNKSLIEEIDWYYEPKGSDFYLSKTLIVDDRRMVAFIDNRLKPQAEKGLMVAAPTPAPKAKEAIRPKDTGRPEPSDKQKRTLATEDFLQALRQSRMSVNSVSLPERREERLIAAVQPEVMLAAEPDTSPCVGSELSQRYLVWKDKDGVLGFSNVQYPTASKLSVYAIGRWYNVKIPLPQGREALSPEAGTPKRKNDPEAIALGLNSNHLVWKDKNGTLGFGNVQYPEKDLVSVFQTNSWITMKSPPVATLISAKQDSVLTKAKSLETIASEFSTSCLVWKDKNGTLGFGNVQYPEKDLVSVFQTNSWISMKSPPFAAQTSAKQDTGLTKAKSIETIASEFSTSCLVWKDKNETLGFGNIQYPEKDLASIFQTNNWISMKSPPFATLISAKQDTGTLKAKLLETVASEFSTSCLVWKDKNGTLGFGNIQYPEMKGLSRVCVNGRWGPLIN